MSELDAGSFDYIVVGGGSAGCALAYRLSREASRRVLLLEAGGEDRNPMIHIPLGFAFLMNHKTLNWGYHTEPEAGLAGRRIKWPRGKVLGGTSAINGMVYIRGQREDYDHWADLGCEGWDYDSVLPYFKRAEHKAEGENAWHGRGGPLWVEEFSPDERLALADVFIQACMEAGLPYNADFNGASQEGAGYYQKNIRRGRRQSTKRCYLDLCRARPNLTVLTGALASRILTRDGRATAVEFRQQKTPAGPPRRASARQEIILCGGVINSPQLLELSGIGDGERLSALNIDVVQDAPAVGENLQDHLTVNVIQGLQGLPTFYEESRPLAMLDNLARYATRGGGLLAHPAAQVGVFFRSSEDVSRPDAQIHFAPAASETDSAGNMKTCPGTTATVCNLRPLSRGRLHIRCTDPNIAPSIQANYLAEEADAQMLVNAVRRVREFFAAPALDRYRGKEFLPGSACESDEAILAYIRREAESVYHPVGTCRMGSDPESVVDERLRVRGVAGLRVADASVMPTIVSGNTNAPAIMIAEKCADMLLEDAGVPVAGGFARPPAVAAGEPASRRRTPHKSKSATRKKSDKEHTS